MTKRRKFSDSDKQFVLIRAVGCCEYCLSRHDFSSETFAIEHIIPLILKGTHDLINLAFSYSGCNNRKNRRIQAVDPLTGKLVDLYNPRIDEWLNHFEWQNDCLIINGLTPKGRATIEALKLNREGVVNLRSALVLIGLHPPKL
jgi:HNH endonuclease